MKNHRAFIEYLKQQDKRPTLEKLIESNHYGEAIEYLKQYSEDRGLTPEWLSQQTVQLNKEFLAVADNALCEYSAAVGRLKDEYNKMKQTSFDHNYSATDYADLQFLQTLIKTRLQNESQNQPYLAERILNDYINTQKGARAIMFLANDNDVKNLVKPYYHTASENAMSAAEKRFNADKKAELDKTNASLVKMGQNLIVGDALVRVARERVQADDLTRASKYYWVSEGSNENV